MHRSLQRRWLPQVVKTAIATREYSNEAPGPLPAKLERLARAIAVIWRMKGLEPGMTGDWDDPVLVEWLGVCEMTVKEIQAMNVTEFGASHMVYWRAKELYAQGTTGR